MSDGPNDMARLEREAARLAGELPTPGALRAGARDVREGRAALRSAVRSNSLLMALARGTIPAATSIASALGVPLASVVGEMAVALLEEVGETKS